MKTLKRWLIILSVAILSVDCYSQPVWVVSGAAIGDTSVYLYPVGGWTASTSLMLAHANNEDSLRVYGTTGAPAGIQIYRVDKLPNAICASPTITSTRYFGVFVVNGTSPTYSVSYHYGGNPTVTPIIEPDLELAERPTNADTACTAWTAMGATLDMAGDSLYKGALSGRKEIILTTKNNPLPIELLSFNAECSKENGAIDLFWSSASEINNDYYTIERSIDAINFETIGTVQGAGNSNNVNNYYFTDFNAPKGVVYYRLKQTDFNGDFEYFDIEVIVCDRNNLDDIFIYNNPTSDYFYLQKPSRFKELDMKIYNAIGQLIIAKHLTTDESGVAKKINVSFLEKGIYFVTVKAGNQLKTQRLIIE